jgi:hypothetical protein
MPNYRGSGLVLLRKQLREKSETETRLLARLDEGDQKLYAAALPGSWVPLSAAERILKAAVEVLFPGVPNPYMRLGYLHAQKNVNGIYKPFLHFLSPTVIIENCGKVWKVLFDTGDPEYQLHKEERAAEMIVKNFPSLPLLFRELANGHIQGALSLTGAKNVRVQRDDSNPQAWRWWGTWS